MGFKKAGESPTRLKALVYGPPGCGKTVTALQFPAPAVIDGERGTEHYGSSFDFDVDETSNINDLMRDIDELVADPGSTKTLVVDPITVFMDNLVLEWTKKVRLRKGNPEYELQPADHGPLKQKRKEIIDKLLSLDMNIVCTARVKPKYKTEGRNFMVQDGWEPEVPREVPYMFDTIIRIEISEDGETRIAHCEKDRTKKLPKVFDFTYDKMVEYMGIDSLNRAVDKDQAKKKLDEASGRTVDIEYGGKTIRTAGITPSTLDGIQSAAKKNKMGQPELASLLKDGYGVDSLFDLKDDEGMFLIQTLENSKGDK